MKKPILSLVGIGVCALAGGGLVSFCGGDERAVLYGATVGLTAGVIVQQLFRYVRSFSVRKASNDESAPEPVFVAAPGSVTTTVIGVYRTDLAFIVEELGYQKTRYFGRRPNQFNLFHTPDACYDSNPGSYWEKYNEPWLKAAVRRRDKFICATPPIFGVKHVLIRQNKRTGLYELTRFGREYLYLRKQGYSFDPVSCCMVKGRKSKK